MQIPLSRPDITGLEIDAILDVLKTPHLSLGPRLPEFERMVADYAGARYGIAVNSGTSGLHLCIKSLGIGPGDEVITTPFSFIATSNCILFENATPVFADIEADSFNIDWRQIEEIITGRTRAILPVHVFGVPANMPAIQRVAKKYGLKVIEDAAEALGAEMDGQKVGNLGDCGVFAFYPNKQITTGEGGIILTDSEEIDYLCRSLRNQGRGNNGQWLQHERLGYNYRLSDINCALGIAQMQRIEEILEKRRQVAVWYETELNDV
ncbi:MAG: DegT/DnrJ/EryC1/StrS aminotransferase family protein, partial [Calditrichia bacterium]